MPKHAYPNRPFNPVPWLPLSIFFWDDHHRNMDCPMYESCLMLAAREDWTSFSCHFCQQNPLAREETRHAFHGSS